MSHPEIHVSNLPEDAQREDLIVLFATFGEIVSVEMVTPQDGVSTGLTALVKMSDWSEARLAVARLHQHFFDDRQIQVTLTDDTDDAENLPAAESSANVDASGGLAHAIQILDELAREEDRAMPSAGSRGSATHGLQAQALRYAAMRLAEAAAKKRTETL